MSPDNRGSTVHGEVSFPSLTVSQKMFLFLVVCALKTVRIIILLTLCCSLVGVVLWFTFAHVGTEIRRGERLNQLECSL